MSNFQETVISVGPDIYEKLMCAVIEPVKVVDKWSVCVPSITLSVLGSLCYCI